MKRLTQLFTLTILTTLFAVVTTQANASSSNAASSGYWLQSEAIAVSALAVPKTRQRTESIDRQAYLLSSSEKLTSNPATQQLPLSYSLILLGACGLLAIRKRSVK